MVLTPRLTCIAGLVPENSRLADIGCDHGKLPVYLLLNGSLSSAIGSDIHEGPLRRAAKTAAAYGVNLPLRLSPGLDGIESCECDTISIAGMGGGTISEILEAAPWTAEGNHLLILQPMTMVYELRQWLYANGYNILREDISKEGKRFYIVISARGGAPKIKKRLSDCAVSEPLLRAKYAKSYLRHLLKRESRALEGMERGAEVEAWRLEEQKDTVKAIKNALEVY